MSSALITLTITLIVCFFKRTWLFKLEEYAFSSSFSRSSQFDGLLPFSSPITLIEQITRDPQEEGKEGQTNNRMTASKIKFL